MEKEVLSARLIKLEKAALCGLGGLKPNQKELVP